MSRRGKRSKEAITRRETRYALKKFILTTSWRDQQIGETVCTITHTQIENYGITLVGEETYYKLENIQKMPFFESVSDGTVILSSRGDGALQQ